MSGAGGKFVLEIIFRFVGYRLISRSYLTAIMFEDVIEVLNFIDRPHDQHHHVSVTRFPLTIQNFINGHFQPTRNHIDSFDPSSGKVWAKIPDSGSAEIDSAVQAARHAFVSWSAKSPRWRSEMMNKIADLIQENFETFVAAESKDQGKTLTMARTVDIPRAIYNFRFFASAILHEKNDSTLIEEPARALNYVQRQPVGVAGLISPWNLPLYLLTFKIAPAIAYGNTVVAKPSEMTSVTAWMLAKIFVEAGLPPGVVNFVFGTGPKAGDALVRHPDVPLISFTGSTATGQKVIEASAPFYKKLSLEMGGKNPCIVFDDADLEKCIPVAVRSSFANQGEICLCSSRIYVQKGVYDKFLEKFLQVTGSLVVGHPNNGKSELGALISEDHIRKVQSFVELARQEEATVTIPAVEHAMFEKPTGGYYFWPTVITNVKDDSNLMKEEIFGPVVCIVPFSTEDEVIARANGNKYGLSASVWSKDVNRVHNIAQKLQAGIVWCNCWLVRDLNMPFGGTKSSGIGREGAFDSMDFFTEKKTICVKID